MAFGDRPFLFFDDTRGSVSCPWWLLVIANGMGDQKGTSESLSVGSSAIVMAIPNSSRYCSWMAMS